MTLGLSDAELEEMMRIFSRWIPEKFEVWAFGSRVDGSFRPNSDLDLLIEGPTRIDRALMVQIAEALEASSIGPKVDLLEGSRLVPEIRNAIDSQKKVRIYP